MSKEVRKIKFDELVQLLQLYKYLNPDDPPFIINEQLTKLWNEIIEDPNHFCLVTVEDNIIVSSCILSIIKNLTRGARPYALIENVVTHQDYRKRGHATAMLGKAVAIAKAKNCYKVMLMTSRKEEATLRFYEKAGFMRGDKTGFVIRFDK